MLPATLGANFGAIHLPVLPETALQNAVRPCLFMSGVGTSYSLSLSQSARSVSTAARSLYSLSLSQHCYHVICRTCHQAQVILLQSGILMPHLWRSYTA